MTYVTKKTPVQTMKRTHPIKHYTAANLISLLEFCSSIITQCFDASIIRSRLFVAFSQSEGYVFFFPRTSFERADRQCALFWKCEAVWSRSIVVFWLFTILPVPRGSSTTSEHVRPITHFSRFHFPSVGGKSSERAPTISGPSSLFHQMWLTTAMIISLPCHFRFKKNYESRASVVVCDSWFEPGAAKHCVFQQWRNKSTKPTHKSFLHTFGQPAEQQSHQWLKNPCPFLGVDTRASAWRAPSFQVEPPVHCL